MTIYSLESILRHGKGIQYKSLLFYTIDLFKYHLFSFLAPDIKLSG